MPARFATALVPTNTKTTAKLHRLHHKAAICVLGVGRVLNHPRQPHRKLTRILRACAERSVSFDVLERCSDDGQPALAYPDATKTLAASQSDLRHSRNHLRTQSN